MANITDQNRYLIVDLSQSRGQRSLVIALALIFVVVPLLYWGRAPQGMGFLLLVLFAILLATLAVMFFFSRKLFFKVIFDRTEKIIEYIQGAWLWRRRIVIPFAEAKALKISARGEQDLLSWELKLETQGGEVWPLYHSRQEAEVRRFSQQAAQTLGCPLTDETPAQSITYSSQEVGLSLRERYRRGMLNIELGAGLKTAPADCPIKIEEKENAVVLAPRQRAPKIFMTVAFGVFLGIVVLQFLLLYVRVFSQNSDRDPMMMKIVIMYVVVTILLFGFATLFLWRRFGAQKIKIARDKLTFYHGPRYGFTPLEEIKDITATTGGGYPKVEITGKDKILTLTGWGNKEQVEWLAQKLREMVVKF